jgi:hypothetical protein
MDTFQTQPKPNKSIDTFDQLEAMLPSVVGTWNVGSDGPRSSSALAHSMRKVLAFLMRLRLFHRLCT